MLVKHAKFCMYMTDPAKVHRTMSTCVYHYTEIHILHRKYRATLQLTTKLMWRNRTTYLLAR